MIAAVTGANGLIGTNLIRELLADGCDVVALVRPTSDLSGLAGLPIRPVHGDVLEPHGLAHAFAGAHVVFHAAAHFAYRGHSAARLEQTAVDGTRNVLDAACRAGVRRIVLTSSSVVLGSRTAPVALDETSAGDDAADDPPYVHAKVKQERAAFARASALGIELVAVCPTMSVGPHAPTLGPSNAIVTTYLADPFRMTYPGGCNVVAVDDVARGHILAAAAGIPGERYLLGGENLEWSQIHAMIAALAGVPPPMVTANHTACYAAALTEEMLAWLGGRTPSTTRSQAKMVGRFYWYSHARAATTLGYRPRSASRALARAIAWLAASRHVSRETRAGLLLSREVYAARRELAQSEAAART